MSIEFEYRQRNPSGHWFDPDSMRFFRSRIGAQYWRKQDDAWVFVSSEKPPHGSRAYSVRHMNAAGEISTIGPFCALTRSVANRVAEQLAQRGKASLDGETLALP